MKNFIIILLTALTILLAGCSNEKEAPVVNTVPQEIFTTKIGSNAQSASGILSVKDGYVIIGTTGSIAKSDDGYLTKINLKGVQQWERQYGGTKSDRIVSVDSTADGGYILCGSTNSFSTDDYFDVYLIKTDPNGNEQWSHFYEEPGFSTQGTGVVANSDGTYTICYNRINLSNPSLQNRTLIAFRKVSANGISEAPKVVPSGYNHYARHMRKTADKAYITSGRAFDNGQELTFLLKVDQSGNMLWEKYFEASPNMQSPGYGCVPTSDGGYAVAGSARGGGDSGFKITRTDGTGTQLWAKAFGGTGYEEASDVTQGTDGALVLTGNNTGLNTVQEVYIGKLAEGEGKTIWEKYFGKPQGYSYISAAADGGYVVVFTGDQNNRGIWVYKFDQNGNYK